MNDRERALHVLQRIEQEGAYASIAIHDDAQRHGESGFVRALVLSVLRWRSRIDYVIEQLASRSLRKLDPIVIDILRIGLAQLLFMDVAQYAAVAESMELAVKNASRARGLINAILRSATRQDLSKLVPGGESPEDVASRNGHPSWMIARWTSRFGIARAEAIARANQDLSFPDLLLNGERAGDLLERIGNVPSQLVDGMVRLTESTATIEADISAGRAYAMDEGSAVVASIAANAGNDVLDLAAAPGGKSLFLTARGARVVSHDISIKRIQLLRRSALAFHNERPTIVIGDGRVPPFRKRFQTVLLDAPCSATGTMRKNPEIKWRLQQTDLAAFAALQTDLLTSALALSSETCVYSTCSLEDEENDAVVAIALASTPGFELDDVARYVSDRIKPWVEDGVLRLTPEAGTDGFTAFVLRRKQ